MSVITITREFGSGGNVIAKQVARNLGCHFVDNDVIGRVLAQYGLAEFQEEYDADPPGFLARFDAQRMERRDRMVEMLNKTMLALAHHGNMVILGRSGFAVLGRYADVLNVRVQAPLPARARHVMQDQHLADPAQAETIVKEGDKIRAAFVESFYGTRWDAADAFDVIVDTEKVPPDMAAAWLVAAGKSLQERSPDSAQTTRAIQPDSVLAAAVDYELQCDVRHTR